MPNSFVPLALKEIKELLRDPKIILGMIVVPLLLFPIMGAAINTSVTSVESSLKNITLTVVDLDRGDEATRLISFLKSYPEINVNISSNVQAINLEKSIISLVIPEGFTENITKGKTGTLKVYTVLQSLDIAESAQSTMIDSLVNAYGKTLTITTIKEGMPGKDPYTVLNPLTISYASYVKGKLTNVNPQILSRLLSVQSIMMPMIIMMLFIFSMQIAATSMAMEKEEKTLESLLTLPVKRISILASKLAGSVFVSIIATGAYLIGFSYYMTSALSIGGSEVSLDTASLGLTYTPVGFILLGISLFMALVAGLTIAISISAFAEDVRGAQSLIGAFIIPIILPAIILMFSDIGRLPLAIQIVLYAIPFSHPIIAAKAALLGDYLTIILGIGYIAIFTLVVLYLAARMFSTEKIVTAKFTRRIFSRRGK